MYWSKFQSFTWFHQKLKKLYQVEILRSLSMGGLPLCKTLRQREVNQNSQIDQSQAGTDINRNQADQANAWYHQIPDEVPRAMLQSELQNFISSMRFKVSNMHAGTYMYRRNFLVEVFNLICEAKCIYCCKCKWLFLSLFVWGNKHIFLLMLFYCLFCVWFMVFILEVKQSGVAN